VSLGVLVTWTLATAFGVLLLDLDLGLALLLGGVLVVTGPTVIVPLLRTIRPSPRIGSTVKWEGIVNDPIGAILGVLVFEVLLAGGFEAGIGVAALGMLRASVIGVVFGLGGAAVIVVVLRRHWAPDYLQNPLVLGLVVLVFAIDNAIQDESGLLAVTVMGAALASQRFVSVRHIVEFKENLRVLLIASLFIILAARLPLEDPDYWSAGSLSFLAVLILVVRPAAVTVATWRSRLSWRERVFLGVMAPRGIVAAAVASVFAIQLVAIGYVQAGRLVPLTFLVIVGTVGFYGIVGPLVARSLGIATPNPQGLLLIGASPWVRDVAAALKEKGTKIVLADSNWANVAAARREGLEAFYANVLTEGALEELELKLDGVGRFLAVTPNDEVNALATLHFEDLFDRSHMYQLPPDISVREHRRRGIPEHLRGRFLFRTDATHAAITQRFESGAVIKRTHLTSEFDFDAFLTRHGNDTIPMFIIKESGDVVVLTARAPVEPKPGQILISLAPADD
jgi:NhaP-type Na+/H+ or K+/H+ antiporter